MSDDRVLRDLSDALSRPSDTDQDTIDMIMTGYDLTMTGARIAELIEQEELAPTRSDDEASPFYTCVVDDIRFDFEVLADTVVGSIDPPMRGRLILHQPEELATADTTESGSFEIDRPSNAPFRLHFQPDDGEPIATPWILP